MDGALLAGGAVAVVAMVWVLWRAVRSYRRLVAERDAIRDDEGAWRWPTGSDWEALLIALGVLAFVALIAAVIW